MIEAGDTESGVKIERGIDFITLLVRVLTSVLKMNSQRAY